VDGDVCARIGQAVDLAKTVTHRAELTYQCVEIGQQSVDEKLALECLDYHFGVNPNVVEKTVLNSDELMQAVHRQ
jgi:hypothetical protein